MKSKWNRALDILNKKGTREFISASTSYLDKMMEEKFLFPLINMVYSDGVDMAEEDWDHLLVLDACRADVFEEVVGQVGDSYQRRYSNASATPEWIRKTFADKSMGDVVYVSANPWVSREAPNSFHNIVNLWVELYNTEHEEWVDASTLKDLDFDPETTISAREVTNHALKVSDEYPDKRIIVHYFQPHAPYIGCSDGTERDKPSKLYPKADEYKKGNVTREEIWKLYRENTGYAWYHANRYINEVEGKAVVTADHGELFGEWLWPFPVHRFSHPVNLHHPRLTEVPWAVFNDKRRETRDHGCNSVFVDDEIIDSRLQQLGYR